MVNISPIPAQIFQVEYISIAVIINTCTVQYSDIETILFFLHIPDVQEVIDLTDTDDEDEEDAVPQVSVAGEKVLLTDVNNLLIARMTQQEKNAYMLIYQDYIGSIDD